MLLEITSRQNEVAMGGWGAHYWKSRPILASEMSYMTGSQIVVDGGYLLKY